MARNGEIYALENCQILRDTAKALLVSLDEDEEEDAIWIPLSQVQQIERGATSRYTTTIRMSAWIAKEKGLI